MATDLSLLKGEVQEEDESRDVERLLAGFLRALIEEQEDKEID